MRVSVTRSFVVDTRESGRDPGSRRDKGNWCDREASRNSFDLERKLLAIDKFAFACKTDWIWEEGEGGIQVGG